MQYIDKTIRQNEAVAIIDNLLNDCWVDTKYNEANYGTLSKPKYRKPFVEILLQEQKDVCCYCMKMLKNDHHTTLEHIAPHNCTAAQFNEYTAVEITQHVIHTTVFNYSNHEVAPPKYPHDIAYHNLLACCKKCNNTRDITPINEFIYNPNVASAVEYDKNGIAFSLQYDKELGIIGISTNADFVLFRKLWAYFAISEKNADDVHDDHVREKILEMVAMEGNEKVLEDMFDYPSKRSEFMKYKWFFNYYKANN